MPSPCLHEKTFYLRRTSTPKNNRSDEDCLTFPALPHRNDLLRFTRLVKTHQRVLVRLRIMPLGFFEDNPKTLMLIYSMRMEKL
jgi:hypothetical protein